MIVSTLNMYPCHSVPSSKQINLLMTMHSIHDKILHIRNINNETSKSNIAFITIQNKSAHVYVCFVLLSFVCISAYAHDSIKTTTIKQKYKNNTNCGSAFEPGASGLSYYCASICDHFGCTRHASCVDSKPKKNNKSTRPLQSLSPALWWRPLK